MIMDNELDTIMDELEVKYNKKQPPNETSENEGTRVRLRALLVALVGVSLAACALASQPEEVELEPSEVARLLSDGNTVKRILKPTVRVVVGCSRLNACVTAVTSLMLLIAVMCSESRPSRGTRWLSAPALLLTAYQASADTADALLAAALRVPGAPASAVGHIVGAALLVSIDIVVWYLIAKFFDYEPPQKSGNEINKDFITSYLGTGH